MTLRILKTTQSLKC